ncbi:LysR family transcriptional regulator [Parashewanella curva]|uniref:LysR family transcriptional regulator n=1 Tax=Parashewanella curva TaxID=2338552 RepID=A0A3L8PT00_9GAMM|nr:DNA-binding transcriptional activator PunR [Parashewanella curva]RLV58466.1 LysR family transcriptional regulator [Parashewanella curva]
MFSESTLRLIHTVSELGSFTAAANQLNKVPSAISYSIKQAEDELGIKIFSRHHRSVTLTPAGSHFVQETRNLLLQLEKIKTNTQRIANNWRPSISITFDNVLRADKISALISDFYKAFEDVELTVKLGVFNGVWESLVSGQSDIAVGATTAIPNGGNYKYRDMGEIKWVFCVGLKHSLVNAKTPLSADDIQPYPAICVEDTSTDSKKRELWRLPNQRRVVVPDWIRAINCVATGLGVGYFPAHLVDMFIKSGRLVKRDIENPLKPESCCIAWHNNNKSEALSWLVDYFGDTENLRKQWLS